MSIACLLVALAVFGAVRELLQFFNQGLEGFFHFGKHWLHICLDELNNADLDVLLVDLTVHGEEIVHRVLY